MDTNLLHILLVEDEIAHADWIDTILAEDSLDRVKITHAQRLQEALDCLSQIDFDAVLLDLSLPDSQGMESIVQVKEKTPHFPIIVLTCLNDRDTAIAALRQGVQDYLIKGKFTGELLTSSIRYAIERQRKEVSLQQQALMKKMLDRIRKSIDLQEILASTVAEIRQFLKTDRVLIYRYETDNSGEIIAESTADCLDINFTQDSLFNLVTNTADFWQFNFSNHKSDKVKAIEDINTIEEGENIDFLARHHVRSLLTLAIWHNPLVETTIHPNLDSQTSIDSQSIVSTSTAKANLWGILVAHNFNSPRKWQQWEIEFLEQLTTQVTIAIQQSELYRKLQVANRELEKLAILDGLTGVANRRYFDLVLEKEWHRLAREQKPLSLILCDIDYFKLYNDNYGHPAGDTALQTVAQIMQTAIRRPADLVARYGGEEFALILPDTDSQGALFVANLVRHNLAQLQLEHQKSAVSKYITLSIGLVTQIPERNLAPSSLIEQADRLLYQAKKTGRDRVISENSLVDSKM